MAKVIKVEKQPQFTRRIGSTLRRLHERRRETIFAWVALIFIFAVLTICCSPNLFQANPETSVGHIWLEPDLVTPVAISVEDQDAEDILRRRMRLAHEKVFILDPSEEDDALKQARTLVSLIPDSGSKVESGFREQVFSQTGMRLTTVTLQMLTAGSNARTLNDLETIIDYFYGVRGMSVDGALYESAVRAGRLMVVSPADDRLTTPPLEGVLVYPREVFNYLETRYLPVFDVSADIRRAYAEIARQLLRPNLKHSPAKTESRMRENLETITATRNIAPGQTLIQRGERLTKFQVDALRQLTQEKRFYEMLRTVGTGIAVALSMLFVALYVARFNREMTFTSRNVLLVALPVVIAVSLGRLLLNLGGGSILGAFAFPAGMVGMLGVMLFNAPFALVLVTVSSVLFSVSTGLVYPYIVVGLVGGYTAVASLYTIKERREVLRTGLAVAVANCVTAVMLGLILNPVSPEIRPALLAGLANGFVCYLLAVGWLPFFETLFHITTDVRLIELTSTNHPLLRELEEKAPGTYQHSMNVAKLAESAAEAVGAHYLLVRAGAFFHDVGKSRKPKYYTENQSTPEEKKIHSRLSPHMSTLIIKNHVKDGLELTKKHQLPDAVIDFVAQHHGTSLIRYFYVNAIKKAEDEGLEETVHEDEFRYPGPKPQTLEAGMVMLADTVDATVTAKFGSGMLDEDELRKVVRDLILERFNDGQFDECPLSLRDLHAIQEAFVEHLLNRFHQRIDYPDMPKK